MGIPVSQRPGRAVEDQSVPDAHVGEVSVADRRQGSRKTLIGGRLVTVRLGSEGSGLALDLSESGIGLRAFPDLSVGSTTSLMFEIPGITSRVEATARVEWVERMGSLWSKGSGGRAGLSFTGLSNEARSILSEWMSADAPRIHAVKQSPIVNPEPQQSAPPSGTSLGQMRDRLRRTQLTGVNALQWITERVVELSGADGAAIALDDGEGMVCRASVGNAPDLGVRIHSDSGLSGECVRTGEVVCCNDTENDPRVDPVLCRQLNLRCAMALPLYSGQRLSGVFEVFSARPYAFSEQTLSLLREACDLVIEIVSGMLPHLDAAAELHPGRATVPPAHAEDSQQPPSLAEPAMHASPRPGETVEARPSLKTAALSANIRCDVCGYSNPRGQRICGHCDVPLSVVENYLGTPNGEQVREAEAAALLARSRYGLGESLAAESIPVKAETPRRDLRPLAGVAALVVLVSLGFGIWKGSHSKAVSSPPQQSPATVSSQSTATPPALSATPPPAVSQAQATAEPPASKHAAAPKAAKAAPKASNPPLRDAASVRWILKGNVSKGADVPVEPAPLPAAATSSQLPGLPYIEVVPEAPQIEAPAGAVASKSAPATTTVTGGTLIRKVAPEYPELARSIGKSGTVVLSGTVDRQGMLKNLHAVEGDPILVTAAIQAAQKWRYEPYRLNGNPIEVETKIVFNFRR